MANNEDQLKWDARYRAGAYDERTHPSALLRDWLPSTQGTACDLACGRGRNSYYLAQHGFTVDGYDISPIGLELARGVEPQQTISWVQRDLLALGLASDKCYDLIVMFRFVAMDLLAQLSQHLRSDGLLIVENHLQWADQTIELAGPGSQRFRVQAGQQAAVLDDSMKILFQNEALTTDPDGSKVALAQLVARKTKSEGSA